MGAAIWIKNTRGKKLYWTFIFRGQLILINMQSYRYCPTLTKDKKEKCQKIRNLGEVFHNRLRVLSRRGLGWPANWPTCFLHDGFKIQFAVIVPVFLEFNVFHRMSWVYCIHQDDNCKLPFCHLLSVVHTKQHNDPTTGSRKDVRNELKSVTTKKAFLHGNNDIMKNWCFPSVVAFMSLCRYRRQERRMSKQR